MCEWKYQKTGLNMCVSLQKKSTGAAKCTDHQSLVRWTFSPAVWVWFHVLMHPLAYLCIHIHTTDAKENSPSTLWNGRNHRATRRNGIRQLTTSISQTLGPPSSVLSTDEQQFSRVSGREMPGTEPGVFCVQKQQLYCWAMVLPHLHAPQKIILATASCRDFLSCLT